MRKWVRWWGILAFIMILVIGLGIWYLLVDHYLANNIEDAGEAIVGAKVDIGKADLTIIPLGITINNLKAANPDAPMKNLIDVEKVRFHMDAKYLFERKVIIKDMVVEGLKFNTERETSGAIEGGEALTAKRVYDDLILPLLDLSKLKTFIEQENLQTVEKFNAVLDDAKRIEKEWQASISMMPNMGDVRNHRSRADGIIKDVKANKITGLLKNAGNIKRLKEDIRRDIDEIELNKTAMEIDLDSLRSKKNQAVGAVQGDIAKLREKYTPDMRGFKNFSKYIFKDDVLQQVDNGLSWYSKLKPFYDYAYKKIKDDYEGSEPLMYDGIDIHFPEHQPIPGFFIELAKLSFAKSIGNFAGELKNFTVQQNITGLPTTIELSGSDLDFAKSIIINGTINHIDRFAVEDKLFILIKEQPVKEQKFNLTENWQMQFGKGKVDKKYTFVAENGAINGDIKLHFDNTALVMNHSGNSNIIIDRIESVLGKISNFWVNVSVSGTSGDYKLKIDSDLDNIVDGAVRNIIREEADKVKAEVNKFVENKKTELVAIVDTEIKRLSKEKTNIDEILAEAKKVLKDITF